MMVMKTVQLICPIATVFKHRHFTIVKRGDQQLAHSQNKRRKIKLSIHFCKILSQLINKSKHISITPYITN